MSTSKNMTVAADSTTNVANEYIHLHVITSDRNNEVHFNVKPNTPLVRLKRSYCSNFGHKVDELRFVYEGHRIVDSDTPESLGMENNDFIEIYQEKTGDVVLPLNVEELAIDMQILKSL